MKKTYLLLILSALLMASCAGSPAIQPGATIAPGSSKLLVAHRGASGYAPEHTIAAYRLAIEQGADYVEPDLQVTRDGVLICLHDVTLERTTNVREVFPDRFRGEVVRGELVRRWYASDFTLQEIKQLDAGSWFDPRFRGAQVPTLAEAIELTIGKAGIFPETKDPETYEDQGLAMERLLVDELRRHSLDRPGSNPATPVIIQSFSAESLKRLRALGSELPLTLLISAPDSEGWLTREGLQRARAFATGVGPTKSLLLADPAAVERAHEAGLTVIPYTFSATNTGTFPDATAEMTHFLEVLNVDGLFTNNPDLFPRTARSGS